MAALLYELLDPLGNRLTVEPLNDRSVIIRIIQDDGGINGDIPPQNATVIVEYDELRRMAEAVEQERP